MLEVHLQPSLMHCDDPLPSASPEQTSQVWSYIWLAYSGFYFIEPVLRRDSRFWLETAFGYLLFLVIYIALNKTQAKQSQTALLIALLLLGVADYPRNEGATSFFIYVAGFLPFLIARASWVLTLILFDSLLLTAEGLWLLRHPPQHGQYLSNPVNLVISVFFVVVVGISNLVVAQGKRADKKLRRAQREIVALAPVAERERIARDLHDVLGHTLSVIVLKAELAGRLLQSDSARAAAEVGDIERTARAALAEVRETIGGYRTQGLTAELTLARRALDAAGVTLTLAAAGPAPALTPEVQNVLSLTLREAVTNIVRHAHATHCSVSFTTQADRHSLIVEDDGCHPVPCEGNGLRGMRERVQQIGGRFSLEIDTGTRIRVEVPASVGGD